MGGNHRQPASRGQEPEGVLSEEIVLDPLSETELATYLTERRLSNAGDEDFVRLMGDLSPEDLEAFLLWRIGRAFLERYLGENRELLRERSPVHNAERIQAPVMLHYAGLDERINAGIPEFEAAMKENGVDYQVFMYEDANHAFNNDTNAARYDQKAAEVAWNRTVNFFKERLQ